jgi:tryptophan synthase alpha chain
LRNDLDTALESAKAEHRAALIPYITGGFPDPRQFVDLAVATLEAGADALEIGIPFSDPLLDGASIQRSQQAALEAGVTPADCLGYAEAVRSRVDKPVLFMGAYNPILAYGLERFCKEAYQVGILGLLIPDLPLEEQEELRASAHDQSLHVIEFIAPTSTPERLSRICSAASGFIYCISVAGVTGVRRSVADTAGPLVDRVRACTEVPVAVGFGIAGPDQAREVAAFADGVIVGTAMIDRIRETPPASRETEIRHFVGALATACQRT